MDIFYCFGKQFDSNSEKHNKIKTIIQSQHQLPEFPSDKLIDSKLMYKCDYERLSGLSDDQLDDLSKIAVDYLSKDINLTI